MLEEEVFCTPNFSLKCSQARLKKSWVFENGVKSELTHCFNSYLLYYVRTCLIFTTDLTRKLHTKL